MSRVLQTALILLPSFSLLAGGPRAFPNQRTVSEAVPRTNTEFALDMYKRLRDKEGNIFFSPLSISTGLCMALAGAHGQTEVEILKLLHIPQSQDQAQSEVAALIARLRRGSKSKGYQLALANALWAPAGYGFFQLYTHTIRKTYNAQSYNVDFRTSRRQTAQLINAWVKQHTLGKIKRMVRSDSLDPSTKLLLTNAIYFKAAWKNEFELHKTRDDTFNVTREQKVRVPMMGQTDRFSYYESEELQALEMSYEKSQLSMIVLLPKMLDGLPTLEKELTLDRLQQLVTGLEMRRVDVAFPKFQIDSQLSLQTILSEMGMPLAFSNAADFSGITKRKEGLKLSGIIHKTIVKVNEWGTEAAAVSGVYGVPGGIAIERIPAFRADHPFLFLIMDRGTNSILFMGRVSNPNENEH